LYKRVAALDRINRKRGTTGPTFQQIDLLGNFSTPLAKFLPTPSPQSLLFLYSAQGEFLTGKLLNDFLHNTLDHSEAVEDSCTLLTTALTT
jgi:hypothetical protein